MDGKRLDVKILGRKDRFTDEDYIEVDTGSYGEDDTWQIRANVKVKGEYRSCPHLDKIGGEAVIPRMIRQYTQGGYDYTEVCVDCVIEAIERVGW